MRDGSSALRKASVEFRAGAVVWPSCLWAYAARRVHAMRSDNLMLRVICLDIWIYARWVEGCGRRGARALTPSGVCSFGRTQVGEMTEGTRTTPAHPRVRRQLSIPTRSLVVCIQELGRSHAWPGQTESTHFVPPTCRCVHSIRSRSGHCALDLELAQPAAAGILDARKLTQASATARSPTMESMK